MGIPTNFRILSAVASVALLLGCAGCSNPPPPPGVVADTPKTTVKPAASASSVPSPVEVAVPNLDVGLTRLIDASPVTGSAPVGTTHVHAGIWWILVNCEGKGSIGVKVDPLVTFDTNCTTRCPGDSESAGLDLAVAGGSRCATAADAGHTRNQFDLNHEYDITVSVTAPDTVTWALLVEECPPSAAASIASEWCRP